MSALSLQRALEIGSYPTAWAMLHRLRSVLVRPGRERLTGIVEVDEAYIGGEELGLRGGREKGKKTLVGVAVELHQPRGYGRCRMAILRDASAASLHAFVAENVEPGATVMTFPSTETPPEETKTTPPAATMTTRNAALRTTERPKVGRDEDAERDRSASGCSR